jgi:hypothetical protein
MTDARKLHVGNKVAWNTPQGQTHGKVVQKVTGTAKAGGHTATATKSDPEFRVKSARSGKEAIHRAGVIRKL